MAQQKRKKKVLAMISFLSTDNPFRSCLKDKKQEFFSGINYIMCAGRGKSRLIGRR
jgi:hypothetical protein